MPAVGIWQGERQMGDYPGTGTAMTKPPRLALIFLAQVRGRGAVMSLDELEKLLLRTWQTGRAAWPQVALSDEAFVSHLSQVLPGVETVCTSVEELAQLLKESDVAGLYLACACVHQVPAAIQLLERDFLARLPMLLDPKLSPSVVDEVCQRVRIHLLVGNEAGPQLAMYKGQGSLLNWIRVIAARMCVKDVVSTRDWGDEKVLAAMAAMPAPGNGPELELIKSHNLDDFRIAAREAFAELPRRQRYLLRLHYIDRLSTIELGRLFGVDQSTGSRWIKNARQAVFEGTKLRLKARHNLSSREFESLLGDIESRLDMSFGELLEEQEEKDFLQALRESLSTLSDEQRHLLRLHCVDRRPQPGFESVLQCVREETKRLFLERLGPSAQEAVNVLGDLHRRIDLYLRQALTEEGQG